MSLSKNTPKSNTEIDHGAASFCYNLGAKIGRLF